MSAGYWDNSDMNNIGTPEWEREQRISYAAYKQASKQADEQIRAIVQEAVHHALHPEQMTAKSLHPIINRAQIGVEVQFTDFDGQSYRGVLYPTQTEDTL